MGHKVLQFIQKLEFLDCLVHRKKQCLGCHFEKLCDEGNYKLERNNEHCNTMEMLEYENLVASEGNALQEKVSAAMDEAFHIMEIMQSKLDAEIKADPRKSRIIQRKIGFTVWESNSKKWEKELIKIAIEFGVRSLTGSSRMSQQFRELVDFTRSLNSLYMQQGGKIRNIFRPIKHINEI